MGALTAAAIGAAGAIGSGVIASKGAKDAADAASAGATQAANISSQQYQQTRQDLLPWVQTGVQANQRINQLFENPDSFMADPGYEFRLAQGNRALDARIAAGGRSRFGGAALKALARYNQDYASNEFNNVFNRNYALSSGGQNAATQVGTFGAGSAARQGQSAMYAGDARATGYQDRANIATNTIGNLADIYSQYREAKRLER